MILKKSRCGRSISMLFAFQNIGHVQFAVAIGSRLTICPECLIAIQDKFDKGIKYTYKQQTKIII